MLYHFCAVYIVRRVCCEGGLDPVFKIAKTKLGLLRGYFSKVVLLLY